MKQQDHLIGVDWLRGIAAFGIIGCHLDLNNLTWGAKFLQRFTDLNVGVFAVLAGFFYLFSCTKYTTFGEYIKGRGLRLMIPYLVWTAIYICLDVLVDALMGKSYSCHPCEWSYWKNVFLFGGGTYHLWFVIALFYTQVACYFFAKRFMRFRSKWFVGMLTVLGGLLMVGLVKGPQNGWCNYFLFRLFGFFVIGIGLSLFVEKIRKMPISVLVGVIFLGCMIISCGWIQSKLGESVLILPLVLFAVAFKSPVDWVLRIGTWLGETSFGVYLVHIIFTTILFKIISRLDVPHNAILFFANQFCAWLLSIIFITFVRRKGKLWKQFI